MARSASMRGRDQAREPLGLAVVAAGPAAFMDEAVEWAKLFCVTTRGGKLMNARSLGYKASSMISMPALGTSPLSPTEGTGSCRSGRQNSFRDRAPFGDME